MEIQVGELVLVEDDCWLFNLYYVYEVGEDDKIRVVPVGRQEEPITISIYDVVTVYHNIWWGE